MHSTSSPVYCAYSAYAACNGVPPGVPDLSSWPSSCTSADANTTCYGACRSGFTSDDPPRSTCVFNGTATFWSTPVPSACTVGSTRHPRAFVVDQTANEVGMLLTPTNASCCALQGFNVQPAPQFCVILSTLQMASMPSLICCAAFATATSQFSVGTIREQTIPSLCLNHFFVVCRW